MKKLLALKKYVVVTLALISAIVINMVAIYPVLADYQFDKELKDNCAVFKNKNPGQELDIQNIDVETGLITINQPENGSDKIIKLSYKHEGGDIGCSNEAKKLFKQLKEFDESERKDMCSDIKRTLDGDGQLIAKNGELPSVDGMKAYVEKNCK